MFEKTNLPPVRNAPAEPLPDRTWLCPEFECRRDEFLPRDLTLLHAAARYRV